MKNLLTLAVIVILINVVVVWFSNRFHIVWIKRHTFSLNAKLLKINSINHHHWFFFLEKFYFFYSKNVRVRRINLGTKEQHNVVQEKIHSWLKSEKRPILGYSLLDNAFKYLVGCLIQKQWWKKLLNLFWITHPTRYTQFLFSLHYFFFA